MFLMLAMFLVGTVANAQIVTSHSKLVTKVKKPPFEKTFYLAGGGKLNTAENKYYKFNFGYEAAFGYEQNFKRNTKFGSQFGFEVGITSFGYKFDQPQIGYSHSQSVPVVYVSPFTYSYRVGLGKDKKTWLEPYIGARVGVAIFDDPSGNYWSTNHVSYEPYCQGYEYDRGFDSKFQVGINIGLRLWVTRRVNIDLSYQQGLTKVAEEEFSYNVWYYNSTSDNWYNNSKWIEERGRTASICLRVGVKLNK